MWQEPQPLAEGSAIDRFTPDPGLAWVVAYAGPCTDKECSDPHLQLFLVPMIGWFQVIVQQADESEEFKLRPVIMGTNGEPRDYLDIPEQFKFVAVLRNDTDVLERAIAIYGERFGGNELIKPAAIQQPLPN